MTRYIFLHKLFFIHLVAGASTWSLLFIDVKLVGEWLHLIGQLLAVITGAVMLYKHRNDSKQLIELIKEFFKK